MPKTSELQKIVAQLQDAISAPGLIARTVSQAIGLLAQIGYSYNTSTFPALPANHVWGSSSSDGPRTLAEALLWKMGKWETYQSFVHTDIYGNQLSFSSKTYIS